MKKEKENRYKYEIAKQTVELAFEQGVNFFDCADAYGNGAAEKFFGDVLAQYDREDIVVSSKVFFKTGRSVNGGGLSRKHIFNNIDRSLKNLGMDYIDLYYCHRFDPTTPMEETLRALSDLVTQGKILYYGVSEEWGAARLMEAQKIIQEYHLHPMTVIQPQYHMMDRYIEHEIVDVCERFGIGITPFSPLAQGLLTDENLDKVEKLTKIAEELGTNMSVLALAWILRKDIISSVITGATKPEQLANNLAASGFKIPVDALQEIEQILGFTRFERHVG